ncbi:MAG TPA: hypothetical protein VGJ09_13105 [Bryobacteraceae bacterium]
MPRSTDYVQRLTADQPIVKFLQAEFPGELGSEYSSRTLREGFFDSLGE